jgi:hypothetical protein
MIKIDLPPCRDIQSDTPTDDLIQIYTRYSENEGMALVQKIIRQLPTNMHQSRVEPIKIQLSAFSLFYLMHRTGFSEVAEADTEEPVNKSVAMSIIAEKLSKMLGDTLAQQAVRDIVAACDKAIGEKYGKQLGD